MTIKRFWLLIVILLGPTLFTTAQDNDLDERTLLASVVERLNVRSIPSVEDVDLDGDGDLEISQIITVIERNVIYPVVARTDDSQWWQIQVAGTLGWVYGPLVAVNNAELVPVYGDIARARFEEAVTFNPYYSAIAPRTTGFNTNVNLRTGPGSYYRRQGYIPYDGNAVIVGRNTYGTWWQVNYNGVVGWVSGQYVEMPPNLVYDEIPVTAP